VEITLSSNTLVSTTMFVFRGTLRYKVPTDELNVIFTMFWDGWGDYETKFQLYNAKSTSFMSRPTYSTIVQII
jgi:hypothetical protein